MKRRLLTLLISLLVLLTLGRECFGGCFYAFNLSPQSKQVAGSSLVSLDQPFLFTYLAWEKRAKIENGKILLRGEGITPKGGAGCNVTLDLSGQSENSPALRVKVGKANTLKTLRLMLVDANSRQGVWEFPLPEAGEAVETILPKEGAAFSSPNTTEKTGKPNLSKITQWQMLGDWGGEGSVDVEVSGVLSLAPNETLRTLRETKKRREAEEQEKARQEQERLKAQYGKIGPNSPVVERIYQVAPDILALTVRAGRVLPGSLTAYRPQPGDQKEEKKDEKGKVTQVLLKRDGQEIGWLIGPKRDNLATYERFEGDPLLGFLGEDGKSFVLTGRDTRTHTPVAVYRKSKPTDWAQPGRQFAMRHIFYLKLPVPLTVGQTYTLKTALNVQKSEITFTSNPANVWSEAVHVNQIGFRPDDPAKRAFLSLWMGTGGAYRYGNGLKFSVLEEGSGKAVYQGKVVLAKAAEEPEPLWKTDTYNKTDVYRMDFSDLKTPGKYRVCVEGVGCSYPFTIGSDVWKQAFLVQMKGLYNERSGVELGPPYTSFRKPRDFHPADGVSITQSTHSALDGAEAFAKLAQGDTGKPVPEAWGGYHDAGDWNPRRVTHMRVTMAQLEMFEMFPEFFGKLDLNIPKTPGLPDILTEAQFEIDCFRRLQLPDGGVRHGIETAGDPIEGEVSWLQSMPAYVFAPDILASYYYAAVVARFSRLLAPYNADMAKMYRESALKAMRWGERDYARRKAAGILDKLDWNAKDDRNLAALQLYITTGEKQWHDIFLENTCLTDPNKSVFQWGDHVQRDAAFAYARLSDQRADLTIKKNALKGVLAEAEKALEYAAGNAYNLTTPDRGKPMMNGYYGSPDAIELVRAHSLTGKAEYLAGAVQANQFLSGCNPNNITYTTGLGANPVQHPLHLDSRHSGQVAPLGLTVYGNIDFPHIGDWSGWVFQYFLGAACVPSAYEWPVPEAFFDIFLYPSTLEFTVDSWTPNVYVWGYLAARK